MQRLLRVGLPLCLALCAAALVSCHQTRAKPYNIVFSSDGVDPNALPLNGLWGYQAPNGGPGPVPLPSPNEPWTSSQTDWTVNSDDSWLCGFTGHQNWVDIDGVIRAGTYTGLLTWESHSPWYEDDDYSFNLVPMSLTGGPNGAGLQAPENHIHVEYDVSEVGDQLEPETPWWQQFHHAVDNDSDRPTPLEMLTSRTAIVTGLLGMDVAHPLSEAGQDVGGGTEIHPIWGMVVRVKESDSRINGTADETYAFMARNWGNEGFCSGSQWSLKTGTLSMLIPWHPGATKIESLTGEFNIVNPPDSNLQDNVSVSYSHPAGILLSFKLKESSPVPFAEGTVTEGEMQVHWSGNLVNAPPVQTASPTIPGTRPAHEVGPEATMARLVEKMTPQQRASFFAATAPQPKAKSSHLTSLRPAVEISALPAHPQNPPIVAAVPSKQRAEMDQKRRDALHAIFGQTIPGVVEKNPAAAR